MEASSDIPRSGQTYRSRDNSRAHFGDVQFNVAHHTLMPSASRSDGLLREVSQRQEDVHKLATRLSEDVQKLLERRQSLERVDASTSESGQTRDHFDPSASSWVERTSIVDTVRSLSAIQDNDVTKIRAFISAPEQDSPRWAPAVAKYDTGSDANFVRRTMIEEHGLEEGLQELDMAGSDEHCFHGLNGLEFIPQHTIRLSWCSPRFDKVRTDDFYVVDEAPFDIILGMAVIREVNPFGPRQITALPLRRKDKTADDHQRNEDRTRQHLAAAAAGQQQRRDDAARQRALRKHLKASSLAPSTAAPSIMSGINDNLPAGMVASDNNVSGLTSLPPVVHTSSVGSTNASMNGTSQGNSTSTAATPLQADTTNPAQTGGHGTADLQNLAQGS